MGWNIRKAPKLAALSTGIAGWKSITSSSRKQNTSSIPIKGSSSFTPYWLCSHWSKAALMMGNHT